MSLTQTPKKGTERKQELAENVLEAMESYQRVFAFSTNNMRNTALKDVRQQWKHSRYESVAPLQGALSDPSPPLRLV